MYEKQKMDLCDAVRCCFTEHVRDGLYRNGGNRRMVCGVGIAQQTRGSDPEL